MLFWKLLASNEQVEPKCSVINSYEADINVLEDEVCHLEAKNASLTMNLKEEVIQCETLHNKLKDTLESLDSLHSKFGKLEMKPIKRAVT